MKKKNVTLDDIARALGISKNAVSLGLRGKDGVSDELRQRILGMAREMNYGTEEKNQGCILALLPQRFSTQSSLFYSELCFHMEAYARSRGYLLSICSVTPEEEARAVPHPMLNRMPFQGVVTIGNLSRDYCRQYCGGPYRYLMADQYYDDLAVDSITTANTAGAFALTQHLIDSGHRDIQFIGMARRTSSLYDRWMGYCKAMQLNGLAVLHNRYIDLKPDDEESPTQIERTVEALPSMPTAFVCGHDVTAKMIVDCMARRGLHCPDDYSVVGFDDIQSPEVAVLNLTTCRTPKQAIADAVIDRIIAGGGKEPQRTEIFGEIIYRGSVKKLS